jgi:hypothetical protein
VKDWHYCILWALAFLSRPYLCTSYPKAIDGISQLHVPASFQLWKRASWYPLLRRLIGSKSQSGWGDKRNTSTSMGINPQSVVIQPIVELPSWPIRHIPIICWTKEDMLGSGRLAPNILNLSIRWRWLFPCPGHFPLTWCNPNVSGDDTPAASTCVC